MSDQPNSLTLFERFSLFIISCNFFLSGPSPTIEYFFILCLIFDTAKISVISKSGLLEIDWTAEPHKTALADRVKKWDAKPDWCSMSMSSGNYRLDRIMQLIYNNRSQEPGEKDIQNCRIFIYHPDRYTKEEIWEKKIKPVWEPIRKTLIDSKYRVDLYELDMYTSDES